jgi:hypothetical protein
LGNRPGVDPLKVVDILDKPLPLLRKLDILFVNFAEAAHFLSLDNGFD